MKAERKTLVILIPGFAKDENDSTCLPFQQNFVKKLKELNPLLNIIVLSFQYPFQPGKYLVHSVPVTSFAGKNRGGVSKLLLRNKIYRQLTSILKEQGIDGILSFWYGECALTGTRFARKNNIKHFCWLMGQDAKKDNNYPRKIKPNAGELIALSDFLQDEFERNHGVRPMHIVPPGIEKGQFESGKQERDIDILAAGSLLHLKRYDLFIEAVAAVKKQAPDIKAVLIGNGPEEKKLAELINKYGLQDNIMLTGELPYKQVLQYMQRAKIFLHPSSYEGFGCVCTEALYAGATVIRFTKPMKEEMSNTITVGTEKEMIGKTIESLMQDRPHEAVNEFPVEETVKKIVALFQL